VTARLLDGRALADALRAELSARVAALSREGGTPRLAVLRSGQNEAAAMYSASLERAARAIGVEAQPVVDRSDALLERIADLNADPLVAGIVIAQPLDGGPAAHRLVELIDPDKDVDGATPTNAGRLLRGEPAFVPATALAVIAIAEAHDVPIAGQRAVVIGRSAVVGRPVASLLLARDATVTVCHRGTGDLAAETCRAELLVAAAGVAGLVQRSMVAPGATVIDCGINPVAGGIVGDVAPDVADVAGAMSPVPGGVGSLTPVMVLRQTVESAERMSRGARAIGSTR
jgi:methylenetetrahydrofolate dehydrogenase (NADP+) / methenyltetrahydrofolate cyclohydrolase